MWQVGIVYLTVCLLNVSSIPLKEEEKRSPLDHMLPNGQKVTITPPKSEDEKLADLKEKLLKEKLTDLAKSQEEQKKAQEEAEKEEKYKPKRVETEEEKYIKAEMGMHPPGTPVSHGSFMVDANVYPPGYPGYGMYPQQYGAGGYGGYEGGYGGYGMNGGYGYNGMNNGYGVGYRGGYFFYG